MSTLSNPIEVCILRNNEIAVSRAVVSDSVLYERMKFTFPESWEGYTKTAVFRNGDITLSVILNGDSDLCIGTDECYIPHEVIKFPEFTVSVFGVLGDSRATTPQAAIRVIKSGYGEGDEPSDPTPTEYQQLVNLANETRQIAQSVRTDADNDVFKGEKGDPGAQGLKGDKGDKGDPAITDQTYSPTSANAQSGKAVAEAVLAEEKRADNTFANALENKKSGITLMIDDISPISNKLKVKSIIELVQEGAGDPSFNNIRPIQGWDGVTLTLENGIQADTRNYTCAFPETVYGGTLDWESGVLTVSWINVLLNGTEPFTLYEKYDNGFIRFWWIGAHTAGHLYTYKVLSDRFKTVKYTNDNCVFLSGTDANGILNIVINTEYIGGNTIDDFKAYLAAQYAAGTPVQVCYKLAPNYAYNIQLTPQQITTLSGANTLYSDSGTTEVVYNRDINKAFAALEPLYSQLAELDSTTDELV